MATSTIFQCVAALTLVASAGPAGERSAAETPAAPVMIAKKDSGAKQPAAKQSAAPKDDASTWAARVQKKYESVKTYEATFEQVTALAGADTTGPKAVGHVWIGKPGKMRWEFEKPEKKVFVSDGKTLWIHDIEENQVIMNEHMQQTTSVTALNFLEGLGSLGEDFTVSLAEAPARATGKGHVYLSLVPKDQADVQLERILLAVDRKDHLADEVFLYDALGNETRLTFEGGKVNQAPKEGTFTLEIPKGAEVIKPALLQ